jgi:hypothetical protein
MTFSLIATGLQRNAQSVEGTEHEAQFGARMTVLDLDHPLTAGADTLGQRRLIELEALAPVANDGA